MYSRALISLTLIISGRRAATYSKRSSRVPSVSRVRNLSLGSFVLWDLYKTIIGGNSPHCIKTEADEGHDHYDSSPLPTTDRVFPSQPQILLLYSLGIATVCSAGRIPMQDAA